MIEWIMNAESSHFNALSFKEVATDRLHGKTLDTPFDSPDAVLLFKLQSNAKLQVCFALIPNLLYSLSIGSNIADVGTLKLTLVTMANECGLEYAEFVVLFKSLIRHDLKSLKVTSIFDQLIPN
jgi:hypothetical protein